MFFARSSRLLRTICLILVSVGATCAEAQLNSQEQRIASLLTNSSSQQRPFVQVDPILSRVARARAADMARRRYFAHVNPDGYGPNYLVRQAGYPLPAGYDQSPGGNSIESCAAGDTTADAAWNGWMGSAPHKRHLLAQDPFYAAQTSLGVGYYYDANSEYRHYWVVITAPPAGPSLAIASPLTNAGLTVPQATVAGTAGGLPAAAKVVYRLENAVGTGAFRDAAGTAAWSGAVSGLVAGPNTVRVRSLDSSGAVIKELTRAFRYVVLKPLVVSSQGTGTITAGFLGTTQRELGATYTVNATAAAGWIFDHWTGSVDSANARLSFVMREGFSLTANFRPNPFYARKGTYNGLVQAASATHSSSGMLKLTTTATGGFSGWLKLGGKTFKLAGKFDATGYAQLAVKRAVPLTSLTVNLSLDLVGGTDRITGTVTDGTFTATISAGEALPATGTHFAAGRYTVTLPPNPNDTGATFPQGTGSAVLVISKPGAARLKGTLADGRAFSASAAVSKDGILPIYAPLVAGAGSLAGQLTVDAQAAGVTGSALWTKPERLSDRYLPAPFATRVNVAGARYTPPLKGVTALVVPANQNNSALRLAGGDLPSGVTQPATLLPTNLVAIADPQLPKMTVAISAASGRFSGSFIHPLTKVASRITGVILQDRNAAAGFFLGQSASGAASFSAAP
jgi:hypothetical protein